MGIGQSWIDTVHKFSNQGKSDSVIYYCNKQGLFENFKFNRNDSVSIKAFLLLGSAYLEKDNYDSSRLCFENTLTLIKGNKKVNKLIFFIAYNNLGLVYYRWGYYNSAEEYYNKAIDLIKDNWNSLFEYYATSVCNLSKALLSNEKLEEAKSFLSKALKFEKLKQTRDNKEFPSRTLHQIYDTYGDIYSQENNFVDAELSYSKSLQIAKELNNYELITWSLSSLADLFYTQEKYQICETYLADALNISKEVADSLSIAFRLDDLARLYSSMNLLHKADSVNFLARSFLESSQNTRDYIISLWRGGFIKVNLKKYEEAKKIFLSANDLYKKTFPNKYSSLVTDILEGIATCEFYLKNYEKAEKIFKVIFDYSKTAGESRPITFAVYGNTLRKLNKISERDTVLSHFATDVLFKFSYMLPTLSEAEKFQMVNSEKVVFDLFLSNILDSHPKNSYLNDIAYDIALKTKGFALHDEINIRRMISNESSDIQDIYFEIVKAKKKMGEGNYRNSELKDSISLLEHRLSLKVKPFQRINEYQKITLKDINEKLYKDEIAIEFVSFNYIKDSGYTDKVIYLAGVLKKEWKYPKFIYLFEENQLKALFQQPNFIPDSTYINELYDFSRSGKIIYNLIWNPLSSYLSGVKRIYISPSGLLHNINFNALPKDDSLRIGQEFDLHILGTTSDILKPKNQFINNHDVHRAWLFGGIDYDKTSNTLAKAKSENDINLGLLTKATTRGSNSSWPFLRSTLYEGAGIDSLCKQNKMQTEFISGPFASETALKNISGEAGTYILHLATHGYFFPDAEKKLEGSSFQNFSSKKEVYRLSDNPLLRSGLIFSGANKTWNNPNNHSDSTDDGILTAYEVSNLDLSGAKLVVMSACETGLGEIKGSEGVFGLQRSFKLAGAENIIMSLWKVPDVQTKELMKLFYENCFKGMTISDALKDAQFAMSKKYPPYYWAAFKLLE